MARQTPYQTSEPTRSEIDQLPGPTLLEFGSAGCGYCRAAQSHVDAALADHSKVRHLRIEDGSGRPLGRSFGVKLWPTFVFLDGGTEVDRLVRPGSSDVVRAALARIDRPV